MENSKLLQKILLMFFIFRIINSLVHIEIPTITNKSSLVTPEQMKNAFVYDEYIILILNNNSLLFYETQTNTQIKILTLDLSVDGEILNLDKINSTHIMIYTVLMTTNTIYHHNISYLNIFTSQRRNYLGYRFRIPNFQNTQKQVIMLTLTQNILRYNKKQIREQIQNISISNSYNANNLKMSVCQINKTSYFIVGYVPSCYIKVLLCKQNQICNQVYVNNNQRCNASIIIHSLQQIVFNDDCFSFMYEWLGVGTKILDLASLLISYQILNISPLGLAFSDSLDFYTYLIKDGKNFWVLQTKNSYSTPRAFQSPISYFKKFRYHIKSTKLLLLSSLSNQMSIFQQECSNTSLVKLYGLCVSCPLYCIQCNLKISSLCYQCKKGYYLNGNYQCKEILINPFAQKNVPPIFKQEEIIQNFIQESMQSGSEYILDKIFRFFQFVPISFFFMRFINFWSICSMYLFLDVQMPQALRIILDKIYQIINRSIFQFLQIQIKFNLPIKQKFSEQLNFFYGISSDFFNSNIQNFLLMLLAYLLFGLVYSLSKYIFNHTKMGKTLSNINYMILVLMQYASNMGSVYFVLITISQKGYQDNYFQKINLTFHMFFIIFSTLTSFFVFIFVRKQQEDDDQLIVKLKNAYDCMCNFFIVFTFAIGPLYFFFITNFFFYIFSIYLATKQKQFRLNSIILSSYLLIFHNGIVIMAYFNSKQYPALYHITGVVTNIIFFVGAIHEVLTLICGILYSLIIFLKYNVKIFNNNEIINYQNHKLDKEIQIKSLKTKNVAKTITEKVKEQLKKIKNNKNSTQKIFLFKQKRQNVLQQFNVKAGPKQIQTINIVGRINKFKQIKQIKHDDKDKNLNLLKSKELFRKRNKKVPRFQNIQVVQIKQNMNKIYEVEQ